jgi:hypothetical protein
MNLLWRLELSAIVLLSLAMSGCGGSGSPFDSVPVSGKVTYEDGSPIPVQGMKLYFHCLEPPKNGMHPRPATVGTSSNGEFTDVTTYKYADGLVLGKHKVTILAQKNATDTPPLPDDYSYPERTPLVVEVTDSGQFLEIKVPKP